jgi:hypothetical protein
MKKTLAFFSVAFLFSCGDPTVDVGGRYEPKIVIDAILFPGQPVRDIRLTRNVPIGTFAITTSPLENVEVVLTDETSGFSQTLYSIDVTIFGDTTWIIEPGHTYRLDVDAVIDGVTLSATSRTTTPEPGFTVSDPAPDSLAYNAKDESGKAVKIGIPYARSVGTADYVFSIQALDTAVQNFIYSPINPIADVDSEDVADDMDEFSRQVDFVINAPTTGGSSVFNVELFHTWFYGRYRVIAYAADRNFRDFLLTHEQVQEPDGNFHEPVFHIDGDGIGVFGSAIADTTYFRVLKP